MLIYLGLLEMCPSERKSWRRISFRRYFIAMSDVFVSR